jgi:hypothetical protein
MANHRAGGGIQSNKTVSKPVRVGAPAQGVTSGYAGQVGTALGDHVMRKGEAVKGAAAPMYGAAPHKSALGNEVAASTVCRPGGSRTVHRSGSQAQHGPATAVANKPTLPADILSHYGPERRS